MKKLILISGKAGAGKDTFATELKKQLENKDKKVLITHYGDLVKYMATEFLGWDGKKDEKGRTLLQTLGTEKFRKYNEDYWVNFLKSIVDVIGDKWDYILIPDCRFPNEITGWLGYDYISVRVNREFGSVLNEVQQTHSSETALDHFKMDKEFFFLGMEDMKLKINEFISEII